MSIDVLKKSAVVLLLIAVALFSITVITPNVSDEGKHEATYEQLDREIKNALKLAGGATAVSAVLSLLPDDTCTPISEQFAELGTYFVIVLSALYLEKYLITMFGFVSFSILIPLACVIFGIGFFTNRRTTKMLSFKFAILAVCMSFLIPLSVKTSEAVYNTYESTLEETIETSQKIGVAGEDESGIEKFLSWIKNAAVTVIDYVTDLLSKFIEAIAVMIVTSCLIPILVVVIFAWLMKLLFKINIPLWGFKKFGHGKKVPLP